MLSCTICGGPVDEICSGCQAKIRAATEADANDASSEELEVAGDILKRATDAVDDK